MSNNEIASNAFIKWNDMKHIRYGLYIIFGIFLLTIATIVVRAEESGCGHITQMARNAYEHDSRFGTYDTEIMKKRSEWNHDPARLNEMLAFSPLLSKQILDMSYHKDLYKADANDPPDSVRLVIPLSYAVLMEQDLYAQLKDRSGNVIVSWLPWRYAGLLVSPVPGTSTYFDSPLITRSLARECGNVVCLYYGDPKTNGSHLLAAVPIFPLH